EALDRCQTAYLGRSCPRREGRVDAVDVERQIGGLRACNPNGLLCYSLYAHPRHLMHEDDAHPTRVGVVPSLSRVLGTADPDLYRSVRVDEPLLNRSAKGCT